MVHYHKSKFDYIYIYTYLYNIKCGYNILFELQGLLTYIATIYLIIYMVIICII